MTNSNTNTKPAGRKLAQTILLCAAVFVLLGAGDPATRFNQIGHQMMCTCGCNQILLECNHVGCPTSDGMRNELTASLNKNPEDRQVMDQFIAKYGFIVIAAPMGGGFDRVAWIMPYLMFVLGIIMAIYL